MKCEVLDYIVLAVGKGSIVEVSEKQFELARKVLKPIVEKKKEVPSEDIEVPKKETRTKKK